MERSKEFQDFINKLPETGTPLIDWHKWFIQNNFIINPFIDVFPKTNELLIKYEYKNKKDNYKDYKIEIWIKSNTSVYYLRNKLKNYLEYKKKRNTALIIFKEEDKNIEQKNIMLFHIRIHHLGNKIGRASCRERV